MEPRDLDALAAAAGLTLRPEDREAVARSLATFAEHARALAGTEGLAETEPANLYRPERGR